MPGGGAERARREQPGRLRGRQPGPRRPAVERRPSGAPEAGREGPAPPAGA